MNWLKKLIENIRAYRKNPGFAEVPDAPDALSIGQDQFDPQTLEDKFGKSSAKEK